MINVIIPTYNSEKTIGRALCSLVAQTRPRKFIVTIVDDASTDNTLVEVEKFRKVLPINIIKNKKNIGLPGPVRNIGIENSPCNYIMFMDADDMLVNTAGEALSRIILQKKPDYVSSAFYQDIQGQKNYNIINPHNITWVHGNVYSKEFLDRNNIRFDALNNEDGSFNMKCYWLSKVKYTMPQPMAYWMDNKESITRSDSNFMLNITDDYINTYINAIEYIVKMKGNIAENIVFRKTCADKLGEFFQFLDANLYNKKDIKQETIDRIKKYIDLMYDLKIMDANFINMLNTRFNEYDIFPNIIRQKTLPDFLKMFGMEWIDDDN